MSTTLAYPYILLLIPLFYLINLKKVNFHLPPYISTSKYSIYPTWKVKYRSIILHSLFFIFLLSLGIGASRPQLIEELDSDRRRNIILCIDVSTSMEAEDLLSNTSRMSRMEGVKQVVQEFIKERTTDRIGLVVFGGRAFLQSPLTLDHSFVGEVVGLLRPGIAGDGTAIGDGLGVALKQIRNLPSSTRTIVLMTDGANNAGLLDPIQGAEIAKDFGIKIHTIGIGSKENVVGNGLFGSIFTQPAEFDEETLKKIAATTEGVYFNVQSIESLRDVYHEIDALSESETTDNNKLVFEYYPFFALIALLSFLIYIFFQQNILMRVPN